MNSLLFLCTFVFLSLSLFSLMSEGMVKVLRWECNTTGITIINTKCRVRSLSRLKQIASLEFEVVRTSNDVMMSYLMFIKSGPSSWRQIVKLDRYDLCLIFRQVDNMPLANSLKEYYYKMFPSLPRKCPVAPGKYSAVNVTVVDEIEDTSGSGKMIEQITPGKLPNGVYRHLVRVHTREDPDGFMLFWHVEIHHRMGEYNF